MIKFYRTHVSSINFVAASLITSLFSILFTISLIVLFMTVSSNMGIAFESHLAAQATFLSVLCAIILSRRLEMFLKKPNLEDVCVYTTCIFLGITAFVLNNMPLISPVALGIFIASVILVMIYAKTRKMQLATCKN